MSEGRGGRGRRRRGGGCRSGGRRRSIEPERGGRWRGGRRGRPRSRVRAGTRRLPRSRATWCREESTASGRRRRSRQPGGSPGQERSSAESRPAAATGRRCRQRATAAESSAWKHGCRSGRGRQTEPSPLRTPQEPIALNPWSDLWNDWCVGGLFRRVYDSSR